MMSEKRVRLFILALALILFLPELSLSAVLKVGGGGPFYDVQSAVDYASDGDILVIAKGDYPGFVVDDKALTLVADHFDVFFLGGVHVKNLSSGRNVALIGLRTKHQLTGHHAEGLLLENNLGSIRVEDCSFMGDDGDQGFGHRDGWDGARISCCEDVAFTHSILRGGRGDDNVDMNDAPGDGGRGLFTTASTVAVHECTLTGAWGGDDFTNKDGGAGGHGYESPDATLFTARTYFNGGKGGDSGSSPPALHGGAGGHGILLEGSSSAVARVFDCECTGGDGGLGDPYKGPDGSPIKVMDGTHMPLSGSSYSFGTSVPVREKEYLKIMCMGEAFSDAYMFLSFNLDTLFVPSLKGQWLLGLSPIPTFIPLGRISHTGFLNLSMLVPDMGPGIDGAAFYLQSIFSDPGGQVTLGSSWTAVILDEQY